MATKDLAQGLASLGRYGDSMLVHMNPEEVAGLQILAKSRGGTLTVNPDTGMPEAFLGDIAGAIAPIALGAWLGPAGAGLGGGFFNSALTAGLAVGVGAYALTGDPMAGLSAGFGAAGGYGLGSNLAGFGATPKTALSPAVSSVSEISRIGANAIPTPGLDSILGSTAASKVPSIAGAGVDLGKAVGTGVQLGAPDVVSRVAAPGLTGFDAAASGVKKLFEPGGIGSYADYVRSIGGSPGMDALTVASPVISGMMQPPKQFPSLLGNAPMASNYQGPYLPAARTKRMPTEQERLQMAAMGSPEFTYFSPSNPVPGYTYAQGGMINTGGIRDLYGTVDDQLNGSARLSQDGYGLGRLDTMYGTQMAEGGPVSFEAGGTIPAIGAIPEMSQAAQASYAVAPTNLAEVAAIGKEDTSAPGISGLSALNRQASQATNDPMGRLGPLGSGGMSFEDMIALRTNPLSNMGRVLPPMARASLGPYFDLIQARRQREMSAVPSTPAAPTMQDFIQAANRTPLEAAASPVGAEQQYFNQVNPQPVLAAQGGIMSLARGGKPSSGGYLDGPGDGMSDSIPATIEGKQPARLADAEFVIPADVVSHIGNGSSKAGAKRLYAMMDRIRMARTGTKKQGKQINPDKYLPA